ncbi:MGH1-like glycoside hydrolase domain-containing protein [Endozoicomonas lisbonensis]|uniref:MGH1-like glycoside hydrolase domain-containing protein n=1 Tax=Endozoicomonas lisbonensis TaxID=3120522 RepID=UPI0033999647
MPADSTTDRLKLLPKIHLPAEKQWQLLNQYAWKAFVNNIQPKSDKSESIAFVSPRVSAQFSKNEFFWDQAFISLGFGLYGHRAFNTLGGLNCFYKQQRTDGFIPREIAPNGSEVRFFPGVSIRFKVDQPYALYKNGQSITGLDLDEKHKVFIQDPSQWDTYKRYRDSLLEAQSKIIEAYGRENNSNPPLAAHAEWRHFLVSQNQSRLSAVYDVLAAHTTWLENNRKIKTGKLAGLFRQGAMGSGMDNLPSTFTRRNGAGVVQMNIWDVFPKWLFDTHATAETRKQSLALFDISAQMKLHYDAMADISEMLDKKEEQESYREKADTLKARINECLWDKRAGFYFNAFGSCQGKSREYALSAYWGLYAEIASPEQAGRMLKYLKDKNYFDTPMPFPALAKSDPKFFEQGDYWRGGVWPPLVYMTLKGLMRYAKTVPEAWSVAVSASEKYLTLLAETMFQPSEDGELQVCNKKPDGTLDACAVPGVEKRIYEYNSPTTGGPGLRRDTSGKDAEARDNFVGWGGLGPVGVMQEVAVGLDVRKSELVWHLHRTDEHGIKNLFIGSQSLNVTVAERVKGQLSRDHIVIEGVLPADSLIRQLRVIPKGDPENTIVIPLTAQ